MTPHRDPTRFPDEELVAAMCRGEKPALEALYERHVDRVLGLAYRMVGLRGPAEEVVKLAIRSAWADCATYHPDRGSVRAWLLAITHDKAVDVLRGVAGAGPPARATGEPADCGSSGGELTGGSPAHPDDASRLLAALAAIPPEHARLLELAHFGGYEQAEIAEMLEVPAGTVRSRMRAALEHLDRLLSEPS